MKPRLVASGGGNREALDERPIELPGWRLLHRRAEPVGTPTIEETQEALAVAEQFAEASPFWLCDIIGYIDEHTEWGEKGASIAAATGYAVETAYKMSRLVRKVAPAERALAQTVSHAKAVAHLPAPAQRKWLSESRTEGWSKRDLEQAIQKHANRRVATGAGELQGMYRVWLADFPWIYTSSQPSTSNAQRHYDGLTVEEGIKMGPTVQAHAMRNAVLFFWVTAPMLCYASDVAQGPDWFRVMHAWGFTPKTGGIWDKAQHGFGNYLSIQHEHLLIGVRGSCTPDRRDPMIRSIFTERKSPVHSQKPQLVVKAIERLYDGPYCELFARQERDGWTTWGDQINAPVRRVG